MTRADKRRVLLISRVSFLGGVERVLLTFASGLPRHGWEPILACPPAGALPDAARDLGIAVAACAFDRMRITANPVVLARYPAAMLRGAAAVARACREHRIDLIYAHHPVTALYALPTLRRTGLPLVLHVHETLPARPFYRLAMRAVVGRAAAVLCVSNAARDLALALGAPPERTRVIHNGVDARFFASHARPWPAEVAAAGRGPHVGCFGVLEPRKAQHVFLEAAARVAGRFPEAHFWLVGPAALRDKSAYAERLRRLAETEPLAGRAHLVGFHEAVDAWLAAMDVVVQPSVALESFGMALAEAQALGRPVIASRFGGLPEVVAEGRTGLLVPPGDAAALADALAALLQDVDLRTRFGENAAMLSRERFAPEVFCGAVAAELAAALQRRPAPTGAVPIPADGRA